MGFFADSRFRLVEFNVENLFIRLDHYDGQNLDSISEREWQKFSSSTYPNKPLVQVQSIARAVLEMDPDILMLCEVGGRESLMNFSRLFLADKYAAHILEGNSNRGIDIGYLVKRVLPFSYDLISHRQRPIDFLYPHERQSKESGYGHLRSARVNSHKFSRDVLELRVYENVGDRVSESPSLVILLVHLKSPLDRSRIDPGGRDRRKAELEKLVVIYNEIQREFMGSTPILLAGDFNGVAAPPNAEIEFAAIYKETQLQDCLEIAGAPLDERFTHQQIYRARVSIDRQIDYIFIPPSLASRVNRDETWVFRYRNEQNMTMQIPKTLNEKRMLPSDHYPVILTLKSS